MKKMSDFIPAVKYGAELGTFPNDGEIAFHGATALTGANLKGWVAVNINGTDYKIPVYDTIA